MPPSQVPPSCPILGLEWLGARCLLVSPFVLQRGEGSAWEPLHHGRDWSPDKGLSPQRYWDRGKDKDPRREAKCGKAQSSGLWIGKTSSSPAVLGNPVKFGGPKRLLYRRAQMDKGVTAMEDVGHASRDEAPAPAPGMKNQITSRRFPADVPRGTSPLPFSVRAWLHPGPVWLPGLPCPQMLIAWQVLRQEGHSHGAIRNKYPWRLWYVNSLGNSFPTYLFIYIPIPLYIFNKNLKALYSIINQ
uniref:uncharacterized protein LOC114582514 isoform X2 n=1 Tax=Podarcis muralis TaxID=64176 RepID=UPI00109F804A|nr:uncharacterized protein LOC114582514 isoform X2 [Podarcis muralis]